MKIFLKIKNGAGGCASERERSQYQIVLSISLGYFFFHFLYYLMWLGRQIEAVTLEKTKFRQLLGLHVWYIARPLFSCINLGKSNNSLLLMCSFYRAVGSFKNLGRPTVYRDATMNFAQARPRVDRNRKPYEPLNLICGGVPDI